MNPFLRFTSNHDFGISSSWRDIAYGVREGGLFFRPLRVLCDRRVDAGVAHLQLFGGIIATVPLFSFFRPRQCRSRLLTAQGLLPFLPHKVSAGRP